MIEVLGPFSARGVEIAARVAVVVQRGVEVAALGLLDEIRQQRIDRVLHVAEQAEVDRATVAERLGPPVDLRDACVLG